MARKHELPSIIIDTREQTPLIFRGYEIKREGLKTGDYSIDGYQDKFVVERKSKSDAYACVGRERERFEACLERLAKFDCSLIVIECSQREFADNPPPGRVDPAMAVGSYISWMVKHRIHLQWCDDRWYSARTVIRFFGSCLKHRV